MLAVASWIVELLSIGAGLANCFLTANSAIVLANWDGVSGRQRDLNASAIACALYPIDLRVISWSDKLDTSYSPVPSRRKTVINHTTDSQEAMTQKYSAKERLWQNVYFMSILVRQSGFSLNKVPKELRTAELCRLAVQQYGNALKFVPMDLFVDSGFCLHMVKLSGISLNHVKDSFIDDTFVDAVIDHYRLLYFQQNTSHQLFSTYRQPTFFSQWQKVATGPAVTAEHPVSSLVAFIFNKPSAC